MRTVSLILSHNKMIHAIISGDKEELVICIAPGQELHGNQFSGEITLHGENGEQRYSNEVSTLSYWKI